MADIHTDDDVLREVPLDDSLATSAPGTDNPMGPPDDISDNQAVLDNTHPITDSNLQIEETYDEGVSGAAEAVEPVQGAAVIGYDPNKDQRRVNNSK